MTRIPALDATIDRLVKHGVPVNEVFDAAKFVASTMNSVPSDDELQARVDMYVRQHEEENVSE